jgi:hypothetical protein
MDHTDPHDADAPAPPSEGFSGWSVVDQLLPDMIQAHHTACSHAMTGSAILGARLSDDPHDRAVDIRLACAACSLVVSVGCRVWTADALARPDAEDPDTVTDADVAAWLVDCLAMDVTLSPKLVQWTYRNGLVSPFWPGTIFKPKDEATLQEILKHIKEEEAGIPMANYSGGRE